MQLDFIFLLFVLMNLVKTKFNGRYIIKRKPRVMQFGEWGVPLAPKMAYDIYPGVERHTLEQNYIEIIPGEDLAQMETMVEKSLPMNSKLNAQVNAQIILNANKR